MKRNPEDARAFLESIAEMKSTRIGDAAAYYTDAIDGKTSSLLTHVSIMLAVLAVFYASMPEPSLAKDAILIELFLYLFVTLGCLLSIRILGPGKSQRSLDEIVVVSAQVAVARLRIYNISWMATFLVTAAFIVTLVAHFFAF